MQKYDRSVDKSGMYELVESWPVQLRRSFEAGLESGRAEQPGPPRALIWAGMGGSAIGGDLIASLLAPDASFPMSVLRGGNLPQWVGEKDRAVLVSFSGNTAETLESARLLRTRGADLDLLTSGGQLQKWGEENGVKVWTVPGGRPPRAALGDLFGYSLGVMIGRGWLKIPVEDVEATLKALDILTEELSVPPTEEDHPLYELIEALEDKLAMVYGTGAMISAARRWACQVNENSKLPAHWGELPEMNHNEVVAWDEGSKWAGRGTVILLPDPDSPEDVRKRVPVSQEIAHEAGWTTFQVDPPSGVDAPRLVRLVETVVIGDWLSYWLAIKNGVDPTPIEPINRLKSALEG